MSYELINTLVTCMQSNLALIKESPELSTTLCDEIYNSCAIIMNVLKPAFVPTPQPDHMEQFVSMTKELLDGPAPVPGPVTSNVCKNIEDYAESCNLFPIKPEDAIDWYYYCAQETQFWTAKELDFSRDRAEYPRLKPRYQELYKDLLGFFQPADALVTQSSLRFLLEAKRYREQVFLAFQLADELVHAESYALGVSAIIPDEKEQQEVFQMINNLDCVKAKAQFIVDLIGSDAPKNERLFAAAHCEGVFFVTLFAIIFYLKNKGVMKTFIFMNKQVSMDETLHRDFFIAKTAAEGLPSRERMVAIAERAVAIEIEHLKYILRKPVDSAEEDALMGLTVENLSKYAMGLSDQIFVGMKAAPHFNVKVELPWMTDIATVKRPNFHELQTGGYKRIALKSALDFNSRIYGCAGGLTTEAVVQNPESIID